MSTKTLSSELNKIFNTGVHFRQPYESYYSKYRRFLSANPACRINDITGDIDRRYLKAFDLELIYNELSQKEKSLPSFEMPLDYTNSIEYRITKNCPTCSSSGYHSYLYEYTWLTECPEHKTKLVDSCPSCHKAWPTIKELIKRDCSVCGRHININHATKSKCEKLKTSTVSQLHAFHRLGLISKSFFLQKHIAKARLKSFHQATMQDKDFTLWASVLTEKEKTQETENLRLPDVNKLVFDVKVLANKNVNKVDYNYKFFRLNLSPWQIRLRKKVRQSLISIINTHAIGEHQFHRKYFIGTSRFCFDKKYNPCPYCVALNLWIDLTRYSYNFITLEHFINKINRIFEYLYHLAPCNPSTFVTQGSLVEKAIISNVDMKLDSKFQKWIYEYELRTFFNRILKMAFCYTTVDESAISHPINCFADGINRIERKNKHRNFSIKGNSVISYLDLEKNAFCVNGVGLLNPNEDCLSTLPRFPTCLCNSYFNKFDTDKYYDNDFATFIYRPPR